MNRRESFSNSSNPSSLYYNQDMYGGQMYTRSESHEREPQRIAKKDREAYNSTHKVPIKVRLNKRNLEKMPCFKETYDIYELDLGCNLITYFNSLPNQLTKLIIRDNKLSTLPNLCNLTPHLKYIDLTANQLRNINGLMNCSTLEEVYIGFNEIPEENLSALNKIPKLRVLDISHNFLEISDVMKTLASLKRLEILVNTLNDFEKISLTGFKSLKEITLDGNKLNIVKIKETISELTVLSVKNNQISEIKGLGYLPKLKELVCDANCIDSLSGLGNLFELKVLSAPYNKLAKIEHLCKTKVAMINLCKNALEDLDFLTECLDLEHLCLSYNKIKLLTSRPSPLGLLKLVDLSHNNLVSLINIETFHFVIDLDLSYNELDLDEDLILSLGKMRYLRNLDLRGNPFFRSFGKISEVLSPLSLDSSQPYSDFEGRAKGLVQVPNLELFKAYRRSILMAVGPSISCLDCLVFDDYEKKTHQKEEGKSVGALVTFCNKSMESKLGESTRLMRNMFSDDTIPNHPTLFMDIKSIDRNLAVIKDTTVDINNKKGPCRRGNSSEVHKFRDNKTSKTDHSFENEIGYFLNNYSESKMQVRPLKGKDKTLEDSLFRKDSSMSRDGLFNNTSLSKVKGRWDEEKPPLQRSMNVSKLSTNDKSFKSLNSKWEMSKSNILDKSEVIVKINRREPTEPEPSGHSPAIQTTPPKDNVEEVIKLFYEFDPMGKGYVEENDLVELLTVYCMQVGRREESSKKVRFFLQTHSAFVPSKISLLTLKDLIWRFEMEYLKMGSLEGNYNRAGKIVRVPRNLQAHEKNDSFKHKIRGLENGFTPEMSGAFKIYEYDVLYDEPVANILRKVNDFAKTPSRPIFKDEFDLSVVKQLCHSSQELRLVNKFMELMDVRVVQVNKTFNLAQRTKFEKKVYEIRNSLIRNWKSAVNSVEKKSYCIMDAESIYFLRTTIMIHPGSTTYLKEIAMSSNGFKKAPNPPHGVYFSNRTDIIEFDKDLKEKGREAWPPKRQFLLANVFLGRCFYESIKSPDSFLDEEEKLRRRGYNSIFFEKRSIYKVLDIDLCVPLYFLEAEPHELIRK